MAANGNGRCDQKKRWAKMVGQAIFYASIQASIGAVEMSSKFSVMNFSKDQETLQRAADALRSYLVIGVIWTIGTALVLYSTSGWPGFALGLLTNFAMLAWIFFSYLSAFKTAAKKYNLTMPCILW